MEDLKGLKEKMFTVMKQAVKLSMNFQGKGTILENKQQDYLICLLDNLEINSNNFKKLDVESPDFNLILSKSRKILHSLKAGDYTTAVRKYVNDVAYMFEGNFKSIAKVIEPEVKKEEIIEEIKIDTNKVKCSCGKINSTEYMINSNPTQKSRIIKCDCGEKIMTVLTPTDKRSKVIIETKEQEDALNVDALKGLDEL
jgi:hypothetical protein